VREASNLLSVNENGEACCCCCPHARFPNSLRRTVFTGHSMSKCFIDSTGQFPPVELAIRVHEDRVDAAKCSKSACPAYHCLAGFARKDIRRRQLRYFSKHATTSQPTVVKAAIRLARWKCILCRFTFTDYPDFRTPLQTIRLHSTPSSCPTLSRSRRSLVAEGGQRWKHGHQP